MHSVEFGYHGRLSQEAEIGNPAWIYSAHDHSQHRYRCIMQRKFIRTMKRSGLGSVLFHAWRYEACSTQKTPSFILKRTSFPIARCWYAPIPILDANQVVNTYSAAFRQKVYNCPEFR
ncbi:hypothetical protein EJ02DRAFT_478317 [Clathrospora elynae]|uniref:Uncharacterized protein n=1 Tax=Clathrospora elynae TaxID=706981 RepID=A0A6A5SAE2_9PLEO|nr:hypothetical protein EJ02DRAFT_478317 [Clathrospora elynae]